MADVLQIAGAVLVLVPFAWNQIHALSPASYRYLVPNVLGSGALAVLALLGRNWGFLLLEGTWALVSAWSLLRRARGLPVRAGAH